MPIGAHHPPKGTNERRLDMLEKRASEVVTAKAIREAKRVVGIWNARHAANRDLWFYPTIGAAIAAECPWLRFYCPACRQIGEVDLRKLDRHRGATIESLIPALSCRRCVPDPPFASCWVSPTAELLMTPEELYENLLKWTKRGARAARIGGIAAYKLTWAEIINLYRLVLDRPVRSQFARLNSERKTLRFAVGGTLGGRQTKSRSPEPEEFDVDVALHGDPFAGGPARVGLVDVLTRIPTKHRNAALDAAIQEIDAAERRVSLEQTLKDKVAVMSSDDLEHFLKNGV